MNENDVYLLFHLCFIKRRVLDLKTQNLIIKIGNKTGRYLILKASDKQRAYIVRWLVRIWRYAIFIVIYYFIRIYLSGCEKGHQTCKCFNLVFTIKRTISTQLPKLKKYFNFSAISQDFSALCKSLPTPQPVICKRKNARHYPLFSFNPSMKYCLCLSQYIPNNCQHRLIKILTIIWIKETAIAEKPFTLPRPLSLLHIRRAPIKHSLRGTINIHPMRNLTTGKQKKKHDRWSARHHATKLKRTSHIT